MSNLRRIETLVDRSAEMVVLPELADYGYFVDADFLEGIDANYFPDRLKELSHRLGNVIVFGAVEKSGGKYFDSLYVVDDGRTAGIYRKMHLTDFEKATFCSGDSCNIIVLSSGLRIFPSVCFDLWFPEVYRNGLEADADLFVTVAAFGGETSLAFALARCAENAIPMVLANRGGSEKHGDRDEMFLGRSRLISFDGSVIAEGPRSEEAAFCHDISIGRRPGNGICSDIMTEIRRHCLRS